MLGLLEDETNPTREREIKVDVNLVGQVMAGATYFASLPKGLSADKVMAIRRKLFAMEGPNKVRFIILTDDLKVEQRTFGTKTIIRAPENTSPETHAQVEKLLSTIMSRESYCVLPEGVAFEPAEQSECEELVRELADMADWFETSRGGVRSCLFCAVEQREDCEEDHSDSCIYKRANDWVAANPS